MQHQPPDPSGLTYTCAQRIATITLNRPERLNAFDDDLIRALLAALRRFDQDGDADVAVLCGNGRAFSSGADVHARQLRAASEFAAMGGMSTHDADPYRFLLEGEHWKPVIGAVHGYALGLALVLALKCDLLIAEEGCRFQITETPRGLSGALVWGLMHERGASALATDASLTGRYFDAAEAHAAGLVHTLTGAGQARATALNLAAQIARHPPLGVRATVRVRRAALRQLQRQILDQTEPLALHLTDDFREAAQAWAEKRPAGPWRAR